MSIKYPTKRVTKDAVKRVGIDLSQYPNAGPNPNVAGMKSKYWGTDAYCVRLGAYVYNVPKEVYDAL